MNQDNPVVNTDIPASRDPADPRAVENILGAIPGQPTILFWDAVADVVVSLCPTPQFGLVTAFPDNLNYCVTVTGPKISQLSKEDAPMFIERALNTLNLGSLVNPGSEVGEDSSLTYRLATNPTPEVSDDTISYRAIVCVPVSPEILHMNIELAKLQYAAAKKVEDSLAPKEATDNMH